MKTIRSQPETRDEIYGEFRARDKNANWEIVTKWTKSQKNRTQRESSIIQSVTRQGTSTENWHWSSSTYHFARSCGQSLLGVIMHTTHPFLEKSYESKRWSFASQHPFSFPEQRPTVRTEEQAPPTFSLKLQGSSVTQALVMWSSKPISTSHSATHRDWFRHRDKTQSASGRPPECSPGSWDRGRQAFPWDANLGCVGDGARTAVSLPSEVWEWNQN